MNIKENNKKDSLIGDEININNYNEKLEQETSISKN